MVTDVAVVVGLAAPWLTFYAWYARKVLSGTWDRPVR
jgi:hypothetical protein